MEDTMTAHEAVRRSLIKPLARSSGRKVVALSDDLTVATTVEKNGQLVIWTAEELLPEE
jgi:hypothetical protein